MYTYMIRVGKVAMEYATVEPTAPLAPNPAACLWKEYLEGQLRGVKYGQATWQRLEKMPPPTYSDRKRCAPSKSNASDPKKYNVNIFANKCQPD